MLRAMRGARGKAIAIDDAKRLRDLLQNELGSGKYFAVACAASELKQPMRVLGIACKWAPRNEMTADQLAKDSSKAHLRPPLKLLGTGEMSIRSGQDDMACRESLKNAGGRVGRGKAT